MQKWVKIRRRVIRADVSHREAVGTWNTTIMYSAGGVHYWLECGHEQHSYRDIVARKTKICSKCSYKIDITGATK